MRIPGGRAPAINCFVVVVDAAVVPTPQVTDSCA